LTAVLRSPLALADLHLDVQYEQDDAGLLLRPRSPGIAAPAFHLVRTIEGNRWLLSGALSEHQRARLQEALEREPVVGALDEMESSPPLLSGSRPLLAQDHPEYRGPAFRFPEPLPSNTGRAELLHGLSNARAVPELAWIRAATPAEYPLSIARNSSGEIVSICHSARSTANSAEAGLETATGYRGRGLADAAVLTWAAAVLAEGRMPLYSTQWTNLASRSVARKLGLIPYGEDYHNE